MKAFVGIMILCVIPGILTAAGYSFDLKNKKLKSERIIKKCMFFILLYYGVLAGVKSILGEGSLTLIESFKDIEGMTYLHYAFPLVLIGAVLMIIFKRVSFGRNIDGFIELFDAVWLFAILVTYTFTGRVNNWTYLSLGVICCIFAAFLEKRSILVHFDRDYKARMKYVVPVVLFWVVSSVLYFPSELFLTNVSEFPMQYSFFIGILLAQGVITLMVYMGIGTYFFTDVLFELFYTGLFSITFTGYIQTMLFNGRLNSLDGSAQEWSAVKIGINAVVWLLIMAVIFLFKTKQKEKAEAVYRTICICICLMQAVMTINLMFSAKDLNKKDSVLTREECFDLHKTNNVLVFILDFFDSQVIDQILEQDEKFLDPICDFTYYPNTTSRYAFTNESIPYLLTGVEAENVNQFSVFQYTEYAFENSTFLNDIADLGYEVGIYTEAHYLGEEVKDIIRNYSEDAEKIYHVDDIISLMGRSSKYKMAPFILKRFYWYDSGEIEKLAVKKNAYSTIEDLVFYKELCQNGIKINDSTEKKGVFRFYHLYGAHAPYQMTDELKDLDSNDRSTPREQMLSQARGSLKIVYEYIRQLKELGLYDQATIIITSDHGQNYLLEEERVKLAEELELKETSNPILFVKRAHQKESSELTVSTAPLSHTDLHATIIEACQGDSGKYGKTIDDYQEDEVRERKFLYGRADIPYREFVIRGDVRDIQNWYLIDADEE